MGRQLLADGRLTLVSFPVSHMTRRELINADQRVHITAEKVTVQQGLEAITTLALSHKLTSQPTHQHLSRSPSAS